MIPGKWSQVISRRMRGWKAEFTGIWRRRNGTSGGAFRPSSDGHGRCRQHPAKRSRNSASHSPIPQMDVLPFSPLCSKSVNLTCQWFPPRFSRSWLRLSAAFISRWSVSECIITNPPRTKFRSPYAIRVILERSVAVRCSVKNNPTNLH